MRLRKRKIDMNHIVWDTDSDSEDRDILSDDSANAEWTPDSPPTQDIAELMNLLGEFPEPVTGESMDINSGDVRSNLEHLMPSIFNNTIQVEKKRMSKGKVGESLGIN